MGMEGKLKGVNSWRSDSWLLENCKAASHLTPV